MYVNYTSVLFSASTTAFGRILTLISYRVWGSKGWISAPIIVFIIKELPEYLPIKKVRSRSASMSIPLWTSASIDKDFQQKNQTTQNGSQEKTLASGRHKKIVSLCSALVRVAPASTAVRTQNTQIQSSEYSRVSKALFAVEANVKAPASKQST